MGSRPLEARGRVPRDPGSYEEACRAALERELRELSRVVTPKVAIRDVSLTGAYPDTAIVVCWFDGRDGSEKRYRRTLWDFRDAMDAEAPEEVAMQLSIEFMEK